MKPKTKLGLCFLMSTTALYVLDCHVAYRKI